MSSFPHFSAFGLNTENGKNAGKMRTRKTPNTDTFYHFLVCGNKINIKNMFEERLIYF